MQLALIDENDRVVAFSDGLISADDWSHPDNMRVVSAEGFVYDPNYNEYDYKYENGTFVLDIDAIEERERNRPYDAQEVLAAVFKETPEMLDALPDETLMHMAPYMEEWEIDHAYEVGNKVQYQDRPYRCLQPHTSTEVWNPADAISLWARIIASDDPSKPLPWEQPDSTNPYMTGDRVTHNGHIWESDIDYNVYEPGVAGWTCLDPDPTPEPEPEPEPTPEPEPSDYDVWVQPDSTNAYKIGDRVHFPTADDPVYESDYDNNVWAPNVFGWHVVEAD